MIYVPESEIALYHHFHSMLFVVRHCYFVFVSQFSRRKMKKKKKNNVNLPCDGGGHVGWVRERKEKMIRMFNCHINGSNCL